jgi:hypothetical protein
MNLKQIREMSDNICNYRVRIATLEALVICKNCFASVVGVSRINFATYRFEKNGYDLARKQAVKAWNRRYDNGKL